MNIDRIIARNFKTYQSLDLDLTVQEDRPIILIGGANGGGKTTLFEAIYGALYGIEIDSKVTFNEFFNAGLVVENSDSRQIELEIHFRGHVLGKEYKYMLSRIYYFLPNGRVGELVRLNMEGTVFKYGPAIPQKEREKAKAEVDRIIRANLPRELSKYFMFDAMESGNLLKEDQLNTVIRENIQHVMGFRKYEFFSHISDSVFQKLTSERIEQEKDRLEYENLTAKREELYKRRAKLHREYEQALNYSVENKSVYESALSGSDQETSVRKRIKTLEQKLDTLNRKTFQFKRELDDFLKNMEEFVGLPNLVRSMESKLKIALEQATENTGNANVFSMELIERYLTLLNEFLATLDRTPVMINKRDFIKFIQSKEIDSSEQPERKSVGLSKAEIEALKRLINRPYSNPFLGLSQQKELVDTEILDLDSVKAQIAELKSETGAVDYALIDRYEKNEKKILELDESIKKVDKDSNELEQKISQIDIQVSTEPDPIYELSKRLPEYFREAANELLRQKKLDIESTMKTELNRNLIVYQNMIDRVELTEDLRDLTFKLFHKHGNEISLNQLNTASKQIVVQCLLKALHEHGDYEPPVMIDTVMGVLDEQSRSTLLEYYFPSLSHQTILFSSNSEIRIDDVPKIQGFVSRFYTLVRDKELQKTEVIVGYFGGGGGQ